MRIALVSSYAFTDEPGGVRDFILGLKKALQKHGCKVYIIAPGSKRSCEEGLADFVLGRDFRLATDQTRFGASFCRKKTAQKILEKIHSDIIVIHEPFIPSIGYALIFAAKSIKNNAKPVIVGQFHARREGLSLALKIAEFIFRRLIPGYVSTINNNLDGRIAVSDATKKFWQNKLPADYKVIYNGINTDELTPNGQKIESWRENPTSPRLRGARIILFAGRHDPRKGIEDLIKAFDILVLSGHKKIRLKIAGKGEMTKALREMVKKLKLEKFIQFVGILPREKLVKAYRTADLVVAPSAGGEGFNRTIIEARSCGLLVVCTDIEGHREAIGKDLFPFMAKPKNPHSLAKQIKTVLNLPETEKQRIKKQGREEVISRFDWDKIVGEHLEYYKNLISKRF